MREYISREAVLAQKGICYDSEGHLLYAVGTGNILHIPAADVVEMKHGSWVIKGNAQPISNDKVYGCSLCDDKNRRYYEWQLSNYCPNCGARMDGIRNE